ncbi:succinate dehydrogenase, hydrophobic membrane anchor protein, partial [Pseudoalteromonas citrea]
LLIAAYAVFYVGYLLQTPDVRFDAWHGLFSNLAVKAATLLTLVCIIVHTTFGLWLVLTDYEKCTTLRSLLVFVFNNMALAYLAIGLV